MPSGPIYDLTDAQRLVGENRFWIDEDDRKVMAQYGYTRKDLRDLFLKLDATTHYQKSHQYSDGCQMDEYQIGTISPDRSVMHVVYIKFHLTENGGFLMVPSFHPSDFGADYELL